MNISIIDSFEIRNSIHVIQYDVDQSKYILFFPKIITVPIESFEHIFKK